VNARAASVRSLTAAAVAIAVAGCGPTSVQSSRGGGGDVAGVTEPTGAVFGTVKLRDYGTDVAATADGRVYVTVVGGRVIVIDPAQARVMAEVDVEGEPYALAATPDGRRVYVVDLHGRDIAVVDTAGARVTARIPVGTLHRASHRPSAAVSRDGSRVYATDTGRDHLLVIRTDTNQVVKELLLDIHPVDIAVGADGSVVYVAGCRLNCSDGTLLAIDTTSWAPVGRVDLPSPPSAVVVTPDGRRAYVTNARDATVTSINLATQKRITIAVGPQPAGIAIDPAGRFVYVTSIDGGTLSAISTATNTVVGIARVGKTPRAIAISADGSRAYVAHTTSVLSIVDLGRIAQQP
jgi:YVTN family beta-propeller protein